MEDMFHDPDETDLGLKEANFPVASWNSFYLAATFDSFYIC